MVTAFESALDAANELSSRATALHRRRLGQYFTPPEVAETMATYINTAAENPGIVKILDPCCGTGVLACALGERLIATHSVTAIHITCYEKDEVAAGLAENALRVLQQQAVTVNCQIEFSVIKGDFILLHHHLFNSSDTEVEMPAEQFDYIIANPPFYKPVPGDAVTLTAGHVCYGQPNVYLMFLFAAAKLLRLYGELVFLIPRSFSCGGQFAAFRNRFLETMQLLAIRYYAAGSVSFGDDCKAFEQIIIHAKREITIPDVYQFGYRYSDAASLLQALQSNLTYHKNSNVLPLPESEELRRMLFDNHTPFSSLHSMQLVVATGNVMVSAVKQNRADAAAEDALPIVWLNSKKDEAIITTTESSPISHLRQCEEMLSMGIPAGNYVVLRRYSTGTVGKILQAELLHREKFPQEQWLMDKKLIYITKANGMLSELEAETIVQVLNSHAAQEYVHMLYGTINLQPGELQGLINAPN